MEWWNQANPRQVKPNIRYVWIHLYEKAYALAMSWIASCTIKLKNCKARVVKFVASVNFSFLFYKKCARNDWGCSPYNMFFSTWNYGTCFLATASSSSYLSYEFAYISKFFTPFKFCSSKLVEICSAIILWRRHSFVFADTEKYWWLRVWWRRRGVDNFVWCTV